jgi:hypothetical protein
MGESIKEYFVLPEPYGGASLIQFFIMYVVPINTSN